MTVSLKNKLLSVDLSAIFIGPIAQKLRTEREGQQDTLINRQACHARAKSSHVLAHVVFQITGAGTCFQYAVANNRLLVHYCRLNLHRFAMPAGRFSPPHFPPVYIEADDN